MAAKKKKRATKKKNKATKKKPAAARASDADAAAGRYVRSAGRIKASLTETIKYLRRARRTAPLADRPWYTQAISGLRDEFAEVQAELLAFLDEQTSMTPPTPAESKAIEDMADGLDDMIASAVRAKTILDTATKLADSLQA